MVSDATAKVGDTVSDLAAKTEKWFRTRSIKANPCCGICRQAPGRQSTKLPAWLATHRAPEFRL